MWQTVSVREVDEEEEYLQSEMERNHMLTHNNNQNSNTDYTKNTLRMNSNSSGISKEIGEGNDREGESDNALSAYDPYGRHTHMYKGIQISTANDKDYKEKVVHIYDVSIDYYHN